MPMYSYVCEACNHGFDKSLKIADRKQPESEPCPNCGEKKVQHTITGTTIVAGVNHVYSKIPDGFRDILKNVKKHNPRSTINAV